MTSETRKPREDGPATESDSWDGITIGIVDAIATMTAVLNDRLRKKAAEYRRRRTMSGDEDWTWFSQEVQDALTDLKFSQPMQDLIYRQEGRAMEIIKESADLLRKGTPRKDFRL